ncbi:MAG: division/cell wall cluster transcriptional repressor MraZ [Chloroflexi bacterium]|nr:MAG: division/cell wall cluster transcriptional repressor MraZ [Chloroflexota bacterium]
MPEYGRIFRDASRGPPLQLVSRWLKKVPATGSVMFLGEHEHTIDAKGRMAVPAKFRAQMDRGGVISKGMGVCLSVYTMQGWEEKSAELVSGKSSDELRDFERRIYPSASEIELDGQGRMIIPAKLRAYAELGTEVTVAGVRDHFEIWDRATWQAYQEKLEAEGGTNPF